MTYMGPLVELLTSYRTLSSTSFILDPAFAASINISLSIPKPEREI